MYDYFIINLDGEIVLNIKLSSFLLIITYHINIVNIVTIVNIRKVLFKSNPFLLLIQMFQNITAILNLKEILIE